MRQTYLKKKETKQRKESETKKNQNEMIIKDKIMRDVWTLFEQDEEDYYKPKRLVVFGTKITLNTKGMVIKIATYH